MEDLDNSGPTKSHHLDHDEEEKHSPSNQANFKLNKIELDQEIQFENRPSSQSHEKGVGFGSGSKQEVPFHIFYGI